MHIVEQFFYTTFASQKIINTKLFHTLGKSEKRKLDPHRTGKAEKPPPFPHAPQNSSTTLNKHLSQVLLDKNVSTRTLPHSLTGPYYETCETLHTSRSNATLRGTRRPHHRPVPQYDDGSPNVLRKKQGNITTLIFLQLSASPPPQPFPGRGLHHRARG